MQQSDNDIIKAPCMLKFAVPDKTYDQFNKFNELDNHWDFQQVTHRLTALIAVYDHLCFGRL